MKRYLLYTAGVIVLLVAGALSYVKVMLPDVGPAPNIKVEMTDERVGRGKYLANHVMLCMVCHSTRDWSLFSGPVKPGTAGAGSAMFDQSFGLPGRFVATNLTPAGLGSWSDGEIFRAITAGVSKDGSALFPVMPYHQYGQLDEADIKAVIAYIRTLDPIKNELPVSKPDFPVNFIINTMPRKAKLAPIPSKSNRVNYGRYIATASCSGCHTARGKASYAGGFEFRLPDGSIVRSLNITPHETGIGRWTKEQFAARFKKYAEAYVPVKVSTGAFQTVMPWQMYAGMKEGDIEAIYDYLQTIPAVDNTVERFTPAHFKGAK